MTMTMRSDHTAVYAATGFLVCNADYHAPMPQSDRDAKLALTLPEHVLSIIDGWAAVELQATPEEVLEAIADALCTNEELRQYAAELFEE
jgi:hypothetical protein